MSSASYGVTLAWLLPRLGTTARNRRWANRFGLLIAVMLGAEDLVIVTQVMRGRSSHFNLSTPLDAALWSSMGFMIVALWLGTAGIAVLSWRVRVGGDLRVPHFVGLHAIQVLLVLALVLLRLALRLRSLRSESFRTRVVVIASTAYTWVLAVLTWQALRAQSVVDPDALTIAVSGALVLSTLVTGRILPRARPAVPEPAPARKLPA